MENPIKIDDLGGFGYPYFWVDTLMAEWTVPPQVLQDETLGQPPR